MKIEKIIAREGLILIALAFILYFALILYRAVPVALPKYRVQFADGREYVIVIHPDINYKNTLDSGVLLKEIHNPPAELVSRRIEEFARQANINSKPVGSRCINAGQLYLSGIYSGILSQPFIIKLLFVYVFLLLARFIAWAARALKT